MKALLGRLTATFAVAAALVGAVGVGSASANSIADIGLWSSDPKGVLCVQYGLDEYYYQATGNFGTSWVVPDGSYGPKTQQAVKWFQEFINERATSNALAVDGIVGQQTGTFMENYAYHAYQDQLGPSWLSKCDLYLPGQF